MEYTLVRSKRKTVALQINAEGELIVRAPMLYSERKIKKLIEEHREWIEKKKRKALKEKEITPSCQRKKLPHTKSRQKLCCLL